MSKIYQKQWNFLKNKLEAGNLAHAYIFSGSDIANIKQFAEELISLVCNAKLNIQQYPDVLMVGSKNSSSSIKNEKDMMEIDIGQIRNVQSFLSYTSYYGGYKVVMIEHAERMNIEAQHCFLKSLEEPKGKTLIILLCDKPDMVLPTISSRCQTITFFTKNLRDIQLPKELESVIHADLAEKFKYAKGVNLEGDYFNQILDGLQQYFRNMLLGKIGVTKVAENNYSIEKLQKIITLLQTLSYQAKIYNINKKLALELLLLEL